MYIVCVCLLCYFNRTTAVLIKLVTMDFQIKLITTTITFTQYSLYSDIFRFILQCMLPQGFIFVYEDVDITQLNVHIHVPVIQVLVLVGVYIIIVPLH